MHTSTKLFGLPGLLLIMGILLASLPSHATAFSIPTSDQLIHGELLLPDGEKVEFYLREGTMLKLRDTEEDYYYSLTPTVNGNEVTFTLFRLKEVSPGNEMVIELGQGQAWVDETASIPGVSQDVELRVLEISKHDLPTSQQAPTIDQLGMKRLPDLLDQSGTCCVTCGSTTVCGCAVSMSCGSCCSDSCCGGGDDGDKEPFEPTP